MHFNHVSTRTTSQVVSLLYGALFGFAPFLGAQEPASTLPTLPVIPEPPTLAVMGHDGWFFLPSEIRHLATVANVSPPTGENDPLPAILDFQQSLARKGIRLVILPVPEKSLIRADQLFPASEVAAAAGYAKASGRFIDALRAKGVDVMDTRLLLTTAAAHAEEGRDPVYCKTDSHFTPHTTAMLARAIASHIHEIQPDMVRQIGAGPIAGPECKITIHGDLVPPETIEKIAFHGVTKATGAAMPDPASPVLLLGDSHCLVFHAGGDMLAKDGGLADNLGVELGCFPDIIAVRGSGATAARVNLYRKVHKDPGFLANKKIVLWCFAAREFTQSDGWKIVPLP